MKKNVIVGQSGGPTAVINASLYGVVYEALKQKEQIGTVYGMINGIEGFLADTIMNMDSIEQSGELELIKTTPGSFLGSCRYKLPEDLKDDVYPLLFKKFEEYGIGYFFYIGGNDSMDTVSKLSRYAAMIGSDICFIGIPKTIDNDLVLTDHTPDLEVPQNMLPPLSVRFQLMLLSMIIRSLLQLLRSWDVMPAGSQQPVFLRENLRTTTRY